MLHDYHLYTCPAADPRGAARRLPAPLRPHPVVAARQLADPPGVDARGDLPRPARQRHHRLPHHRLRAATSSPAAELMELEVDYERGASSTRGPRDLGPRLPARDRRRQAARGRRLAEAVAEYEREVLARRRDHLILRVDRADLSKNVLRGFTAFDVFLDQHPEFRESVTFVAHLQPSRRTCPSTRSTWSGSRRWSRSSTTPRDDRLDADRPADLRQLLRGGGPLQALRPADRQPDVRRHEPGRQGGARRSTPATAS